MTPPTLSAEQEVARILTNHLLCDHGSLDFDVDCSACQDSHKRLKQEIVDAIIRKGHDTKAACVKAAKDWDHNSPGLPHEACAKFIADTIEREIT